MKKILSLFLAVLMIASVFTAVPVMAQDDAVVLDENYGKVKVTGKVQSNGSIAFGVRSAFGDSETQDVIQYFVSPRGDETSYGMENHQAFDFYSYQELVSKTSSTVFSSGTKSGGDERTPVSLSGFGWIGAGHGMTCAVNVTGEHGLTYANIGEVYKDINNKEWVLLRVTQVKSGSAMVPSLVFISKNLKSGKNDTNPAFETMTDAHLGTDLVNVNDANNKVTINKYSNSSWLKPAYNMTKQNVYVVNDGVKTLVQADGSTVEGDYVLVEEEYTIMNPAHVAQAIIDGRPEGGYTENPNLAVGKPLVTFDLEYIYNADGTVISNWETTYHQDVTLGEFGGIQYGMKGDFVYLPGTKPFTMKSSVSLDGEKIEKDSVNFDFSNLFDTTKGYPNGYATMDTWADVNNAPNRRLDFNKKDGAFDKAFAGGQLPVFDGEPTARVNNTDRAFYFWNTRKAYHFSVGGSKADAGINKKYPDMTNATMKGSAYKKWIEDFDANGTSSFYSVPYFSDGDNSRYFYFDLYKPGVTKKYDISAYLGTYSVAELEKSANLEYSIDYATGMLTVSSLNNNQTSADYLVLKAKYVGESVPAVEMKMRALPTLYNESINDKLAEIAEMMETVGAPESDYNPELLANYKNLLAQKEAYEQALKDEAANADRVAGLDNRYEYVDMKFVYDLFATENDRNDAKWKKDSTVAEPNALAYKGFVAGMTAIYPSSKNVKAFYTEKIAENPAFTKDKNQNDIFTIGTVPFKLGKIAKNDGEVGANAWIGRAEFAPELFNDESKLPDFDASVHGTISTQTAKATYQIDKDGISEVNILSSVNSYHGSAKFIDVNVKYENENKARTYKYIIGRAVESFEDTIWAIEKDKFEELASNPNYTADMVKGTADGSSGWTYKVKDDAYYAVQKATKYYQLKNNAEDYPIVKLSTLMDVDLSKISDRNPSVEIVFPSTSAKFVRSTDMTDHYVHNVKIPVDSTKTIETVQLHSNIEHPDAYITESGGFFDRGEWNVSQGALRINYDGKDTVKIGEKEYVIFFDLYRECQESAFFGMTLTRAETWLDRINELNAKIEALGVDTTSKAQLEEIKAEINALLAQNSNIVYVKDFSEEARTKITNIEEYLKTHFSEEERLEMLAERTYTYVDIAPDVDLFATWQDTADLARFFKAVSGTSTQSFDTVDYNGGKIFDWIPQTKSDGTPVTGTEAFYSKGLKGRSAAFAGNVLLIESLIAPEGTTSVAAARVATETNGTNKDYVEGKYKRKSATKKIDQSHIINRLDEDGFVTIKNGDIQHKIGPLDANAVSPNARSTVLGDATVITDAKGTSLDLMLITNNVNSAYYTSSKLAVYTKEFIKEDGTVKKDLSSNYASPKAGLQQIIINYADGETETKYMLSVDNTIANYQAWYSENPVENSIVYAPKYDAAGNEIVYDENSFYINSAENDFKYLTKYNVKNDKIKAEMVQPEDIKFVNENIFMSDSGLLAEVVANQQHASSNSGGKFAAVASIPLKNKPLASLKFTRKNDAALSAEHSIKITTDQTNNGKLRESTAALVPVEIEGASVDFVYFAYCGRLGDGTFVVSATVSSSREDLVKQASEKILKAETAEDAEAVMVEYIDNLYVKYRDLSAEAKAHYEAFTKGIGSVRIVPQGAGYKVTAFTDKADKAYKLIICGYDADENLISTQIIDGKTKDSIYYTHLIDSVDENAASVKVFFWEGFKTLLPYAYNVAELK